MFYQLCIPSFTKEIHTLNKPSKWEHGPAHVENPKALGPFARALSTLSEATLISQTRYFFEIFSHLIHQVSYN